MIILSFLLPFLVYLRTLAPTITSGDSGELITACYFLGIPHPPGYPLYCLLGKLFTFLPISNIAYRVNLMSAFFGALSSAMFYLLILKILKDNNKSSKSLKWIALISAISFSLTNTFWSQSVIAEVYTVAIFFLLLLLYVFVDYLNKGKDSKLFLISFIYAICFVSHYMFLMFFPPLVLGIIFVIRKEYRRYLKVFPSICIGFILGLSIYLYLPIRSFANPPLDWGNPENLKNFLWVVTRKVNSPFFQTPFNLSLLMHHLQVVLQTFLKEIPWHVTIIALFGLFSLYVRNKRLFWFLFISLLSCIGAYLIVLNISNKYLDPTNLYIEKKFLMPTYILAMLFFGFGLEKLIKYVVRNAKRTHKFAILSLTCFPLLFFNINYYENDFSKNYFAYDFGVNILETLEPNSHLIVDGDNELFSLTYLKRVESRRPDITLYDKLGGLIFKDIEALVPQERKGELDNNPAVVIEVLKGKTEEPIYFVRDISYQRSPRIKSVPVGILFRVLRKGEELDREVIDNMWHRYKLRWILSDSVYKDLMDRIIIANYFILKGEYFFFVNNIAKGKFFYNLASRLGYDIKSIHGYLYHSYISHNLINEALEELKISISLDPNDPETYYNMGVVLGNIGDYKKAIEFWNQALLLEPGLEIASENIRKAKESSKQNNE